MTHAWRIVLGGVLMTAVIAWMIGERMLVLAQGREIVVAVEPVDPQDLFRGDYVRLAYGFTRLELNKLGVRPDDVRTGSAIYVVLKPDGERFAVESAALEQPSAAPDRVVIKGTVRSRSDDLAFVDYGIERYFVPQGHGRAIEDGVRERRTDVVLAVTENGIAAIKALRLEGKEIYREGLF